MKIAFLDRDGVINSSKYKRLHWAYKDFKWINGSKRAIKYLKSKKFKVVIVTNQSGAVRASFRYEMYSTLHKFYKKN